jgi:AcrR family transcriptional regulator
MSKAAPYSASSRGPEDHEVRQQIIVAATEHFRVYGYEKTTVADLAKAIGFSKAYIYKFFESKQAVGEVICSNCLMGIKEIVKTAVAESHGAPEKLRQMFKALVEASLRLFFEDRKLHNIAASATAGRWQATLDYDDWVRLMIENILREGRDAGDFERKTPLHDGVASIQLVMRPYYNPLLLQHNLDFTDSALAHLSGLLLRSLSS